MRELILALFLFVLAVCIAAPLSAQSTSKAVSCMEHAEACTYCTVEGGNTVVHEVMDMSVLTRPGSVEELEVHEGTHAAEMRANHALCEPTWTQLLGMETRAYCAALQYLVARQAAYPDVVVSPQKVYIDYLGLMQQQFLYDPKPAQTEVKDFQLISAWYQECGRFFTPKGGTTVKPSGG